MLSESDPYVFVDLDHVVSADGVVEVWAQAIIDKMRSYTELSQSDLPSNMTAHTLSHVSEVLWALIE